MGVRGLYTFIRTVVPSGLQSVNMEEEARKYKRSKGLTPLLVIDLFSFHHFVCPNDHEKLLGGRFRVYNERLREVLAHLRSLGFELVFFADGAGLNTKAETVLKRRDDEYWRGVKVLHAIDEGLDLSGDLSGYNVPNLTVFFENLIHISKEYGELYISVLHECDQEMVRLANERDALAIVSNDTDFLIFDGPWRFWRDLDFDKNTANEYNKIGLCKELRLSQTQMVLFASLAGNDFINHDLLRPFHQSLHCHYTQKFYKIADYVRRIRLLPNSMRREDIGDLAMRIFKRREDFSPGIEALQESINFYCLIGPKKYSNDFIKRVSQECSRLIYAVLEKDSVTIPFAFSDLSKPIFPPYFDFFKPSLCRLIGILFFHQKSRNFKKTFKFKLHHSETHIPVELPADYPSGNVPPLQDLLLTPYGENEDLDNRRWELLCFMISPKLKADVLRSVPGFNLATYATLFFLVSENLIQIEEADCILISCDGRKPFPELQNQFTFDKVKKIDGRDARTAFLFLRMMYAVLGYFSVAGLQKYAGLITFDGLCFHNLRKIWKDLDNSRLNSVREELQQYRIYAEVPRPPP